MAGILAKINAARKQPFKSDNPMTHLHGDFVRKVHTVIGIPSWQGALDPETQSCLEQMVYHNLRNNNQVSLHKSIGSLIWENRNRVIKNAIEQKAKYVLFIDTDMVFPCDLIQRLEMHHKPVVSCMAFVKSPPHVPNMYNKVSKTGWTPVTKFKRGDLIKVDCVGGALMLVDVEAIKHIQPPWFSAPPLLWHVLMEEVEKLWDTKEDRNEICDRIVNLYREHKDIDHSIGEDYYFSEVLRRNDIPIYVDTSIEIGHMGKYMFAYADFADMAEQGAFERKEQLYDS